MTSILVAIHSDGASPQETELYPAPATNLGFEELKPAWIRVPDGSGWILRVDDEPLTEEQLPDGRAWKWLPTFFAVEVTAELIGSDGKVRARYLLDVSPDPEKVGREVFAAMVEEIRAEDPELLLGGEPSKTNLGALGGVEDPLVAYSRLRRHGEQFLNALDLVRRQPLHTRRVRRMDVPLHRVRRADRQTAAAAARNAGVIAALFGDNDSGTSSSSIDISQATLDVPVVEHHLDGPANRCLLATLLAVRRRIHAVDSALRQKALTEEDSATRSSLRPRLAIRLEYLRTLDRSLGGCLPRSPFCEVTVPEVSAAGLNAIAVDPAYARAYSQGWKILRHGIGGTADEERLWTSPTWEIYERWCFVSVARVLRQVDKSLDWQRVFRSTAARALVEWCGHSPNGIRVRVLLQPVFPSGPPKPSNEFQSISGTRIPDIVITVERNGQCRLLILDAKYRRTRQSVLEAMTSAHVYHDSLRWNGRPADASLLLIPAGGAAPWLESRQFQQQEKVGVLATGGRTGGLNTLSGLLVRLFDQQER